MPDYRETGAIAYETFCKGKGYQNWKWWSELPETERQVWRQVAWEVMRQGWHEAAPPGSA